MSGLFKSAAVLCLLLAVAACAPAPEQEVYVIPAPWPATVSQEPVFSGKL